MPGNKGRLGVTGALVLVFVLTLVYVNYRPAGEVATLDAAVRMLVSSDYDESADFGFHESKEAHSRDGTVRLLGSSDYDESADFNFHESKDEHLLKYEGTKMSKQECSMEGYNRLRYLKEKEAKVPPMLYTFPGSGNTWGRLLIEHATGVYSGSVYNDRTLLSALPGEFTCNQRVSVVKVHPHTHKAYGLLNGGFGSDATKCKRGIVHKFDRAILLVRDPFDSIWSEFQRRMNQDHVSGIPESYFDWHRWQANAANLANKYHEMWKEHYILIEKTLPRQNVLYVRYEDLKDPEKRVHALDKVAKFLGQPADVTKLHCAFVLAENPKAHRATGDDSMTKDKAYTRPLVCKMWALFGEYASRLGYTLRANNAGGDCTDADTPVPMVNVGPQGEYNGKWVKPGRARLDFGEHPPNGINAGKRLFGPEATKNGGDGVSARKSGTQAAVRQQKQQAKRDALMKHRSSKGSLTGQIGI